ncbi:hypothetical protein [Pseudoalteromonas byunsanensis]|uniref:Uncharacterized protein n=1 Tax=Pseudoalteromonas byunsanensis TaxID=327939 RepID=A0A1S1NAQ6_9GAMM|nr:hypothetical protein [Pseudoalteromonas byunsanensis]OHU97159.1 hypothetical protein BIW53_02235 [Pseudoalteromonas byunsanensis]
MGRNWDWSREQGRIKRLEAEVQARVNNKPFDANNVPLHSHDGTYQSMFNKGWHSVLEIDIRLRVDAIRSYHAASNRIAKRFEVSHG